MSRFQLDSPNILNELTPGELSCFKHTKFDRGESVYSDLPKIFIIKSGSAKLSLIEDGEEFIICTVFENAVILLSEITVLEFLEDSQACSINVQMLETNLNNAKFYKIYSNTLCNTITMQQKIIKSILFDNAKARIANFFIELAQEQNLKQNGYYCVFLPFSVKVLSSFVGLKRQSASTALNEFLKDNIIRKMSQHEFIILDFKQLENYAR